jgi:hypothetical protein
VQAVVVDETQAEPAATSEVAVAAGFGLRQMNPQLMIQY